MNQGCDADTAIRECGRVSVPLKPALLGLHPEASPRKDIQNQAEIKDKIKGAKLTGGKFKSHFRKNDFTERVVEAGNQVPAELVGLIVRNGV